MLSHIATCQPGLTRYFIQHLSGHKKLADNIAAEQERLTHEAQQLGKLIAQLPEVKERDTSKVRSILATILKDNPQYHNLAITDRSGRVWASAIPSNQPVSLADRRYFKSALASKRFSSGDYVISKSKGIPMLSMGYPLINERGEFDGVIALGFDLDQLKPLLERFQLPKDTNYVVVDHEGIIISRGHDAAGIVGTVIKPDIFKSMEVRPDKATYEIIRKDGDKRILTHRKLWLSGEQGPYLYILAGISYEKTVANAYREILYNSALLVPFVIIAFALVFYIGKRSITDRVTVLASAARQLARGVLPGKIADLIKGSELGSLGETFDDMARQLKIREQALVEKSRLLADLNDNLELRVHKAVDELRQKDQLLIQQGRLAAMGEMINNIAHQWRQPLNNVGLIVQNLQFSFQSGELTVAEMDDHVDRAMQIILHMSGTIDDFRNFFRQEKERSVFIVNQLVSRALDFLLPALKSSGIEVESCEQPEITAFGYPNEYLQAVLNIINNARDVLLERRVVAPRISIAILRENDRAVVTIRDNGGGIVGDALPRIFDPYFTTKEEGKGTGIGLYMSKVIIEQNMGGSLTVCNVDSGAEFRIEI